LGPVAGFYEHGKKPSSFLNDTGLNCTHYSWQN